MARTAEVVRQWHLLQALEKAPHGLTLRRMAAIGGCTTRTIRRDLAALESAGFPLYDEKIDGTARWRLERNPLKGLDAGFRLTELCALYFSRAMLEALVGSPFHAEVRSAFARLERALPPGMKDFLERLPGVVKAKPARMKLRGATDLRGERTIRVLDAVLNRREIRVRYHSATSRRTKDYVLHPYRVVYADGGLYLMAFVPEYGDVRTFALERVQSAALLDTKFTPAASLPTDVFPHSLGVHSGTPERVTVEFDASIAPFVREREWHPSQRIRERRNGGVLVELNVCRDAALRSWILSFGGSARVTAPAGLAEETAAALREGYLRYQQLELAPPSFESGPVQRSLPFPGDLKRVS